jgi:hypothetical protein
MKCKPKSNGKMQEEHKPNDLVGKHGRTRNGIRQWQSYGMSATTASKLDRLRTRDWTCVLLPLVAKQVVTTGEAIDVGAPRDLAVEHGLGRRRLLVDALVAVTILRV